MAHKSGPGTGAHVSTRRKGIPGGSGRGAGAHVPKSRRVSGDDSGPGPGAQVPKSRNAIRDDSGPGARADVSRQRKAITDESGAGEGAHVSMKTKAINPDDARKLGAVGPVSRKRKAITDESGAGEGAHVSKKRKAVNPDESGPGAGGPVSKKTKAINPDDPRNRGPVSNPEPIRPRMPTSRSIHVILPVDLQERERLRENLGRMQLTRLTYLPWDVDTPSLLEDLLQGQPVLPSPIRAHVSRWTETLISNTYNVPSSGGGMCDPNDELRSFAETFFKPERVKKNGWIEEQCLHPDLRAIFAFLTPILKPRGQTRITLSLAITVIASFEQKKEINWAAILRDVIVDEAKKLRKYNYTHITSYLSHIYHSQGCLTVTEQLQLCPIFPNPYTLGGEHWQPTDMTVRPELPVPPVGRPSILDVCDTQLLQQLMSFLVCSRDELLDEAKRLKSVDLTQSPLYFALTPVRHSPTEETLPDSGGPDFDPHVHDPLVYDISQGRISDSSFDPDESYSPTSPPLNLTSCYVAHSSADCIGGGINDLGILNRTCEEDQADPGCDQAALGAAKRPIAGSQEMQPQLTAILQLLDLQVRERGITRALHSRDTKIRNLGIQNVHQGIQLRWLTAVGEGQKRRSGNLEKRLEKTSKLLEDSSAENGRLGRQLKALRERIEQYEAASEQRRKEMKSELEAKLAAQERRFDREFDALQKRNEQDIFESERRSLDRESRLEMELRTVRADTERADRDVESWRKQNEHDKARYEQRIKETQSQLEGLQRERSDPRIAEVERRRKETETNIECTSVAGSGETRAKAPGDVITEVARTVTSEQEVLREGKQADSRGDHIETHAKGRRTGKKRGSLGCKPNPDIPTNKGDESSDELGRPKWRVPEHCYVSRSNPPRESRTLVDDSELEGKTGIPRIMTCGIDLYEHQAKGLHWMLSMEDDGSRSNPNGGILADDQGMGKTIQLIGLMLLHRFKKCPTLIICPASLLFQWQQEIRDKVSEAYKLNVLAYHGESRFKHDEVLDTWDVVITTYTLASTNPKRGNNPLHACKWHRIILDECQNIKNVKGNAASQICKLQAKFRWCVSGTVLSNNYTELYSYFKFLEYFPLGHCAEARKHRRLMANLAEKNKNSEVYKQMHNHLVGMTLRREKKVLNLREKIYRTIEVDFDRSEDKMLYERYREETEKKFQDASKESGSKGGGMMILMNKMQQVCLHRGLALQGGKQMENVESSKKISLEENDKARCVGNLVDFGVNGGCTECEQAWSVEPPACVSACGHAFCAQCGINVRDQTGTHKCPAVNCRRNLTWESMYELRDLLPGGSSGDQDISTLGFNLDVGGPKFLAILDYLRGLPVTGMDSSGEPITEKALIFTQWPSVFPYLQRLLEPEGIQYRIVEGKTALVARKKVLSEFETDPRVKVMLLSLHAANCGLNITAANHVLLISHWWNPASEDQAVDRTHRLGQKKVVHVVRFVVRNTIENSVINRQESKRDMARGCLYGRTKGASGAESDDRGELGDLYEVWQDYMTGDTRSAPGRSKMNYR